MSSDLSRRLKAAGPVHVAPLVLSQVQARASRRRVQRFVAAVGAASVLIAGAAATWAAVDFNGGDRIPPAGPNGAACPQSNYDIALFLEDEVTASELKALQRQVARFEGVETVAYFSVAAAFVEFKNRYKDQPEFWINLPEDALPASLRVTVTSNATDADERRIIRAARQLSGISGVRRGEAGCPRPGEPKDDLPGVRVPRLVGRSYRQACELAEGKLMLRVEGSSNAEDCDNDATVVTQDPPEGVSVPAGTGIAIRLSPRKEPAPGNSFPLDDLFMELRLARDRVPPGGRVASTLIVRNRSDVPVVDRKCELLSVRFGIAKTPDAQLLQAIAGNCGDARRIRPGVKLVLRGPTFEASSNSGEPLEPGAYVAVIQMDGRSRRLWTPVEVTGR